MSEICIYSSHSSEFLNIVFIVSYWLDNGIISILTCIFTGFCHEKVGYYLLFCNFSFMYSICLEIFDLVNFLLLLLWGHFGIIWTWLVLSKKIPMQANLYSHTGSSIKIYGWSGVRFSVRFPVFVLLMVLSKKFLCRKISFVILVHLHIKFSRWSRVRFSVRFPVFAILMVV